VNRVLLFLNTIKYLKFIQIKYRLYYYIRYIIRSKTNFSYKDKSLNVNYSPLKLEKSLFAAPNVKYSDAYFLFLNLAQKFESRIDWNHNSHGKLWTYNLNYFEFLHTPLILKEEGLKLINDFIKNSNKIQDGLEPYPISLRAIYWIKFLVYHKVHDKLIDESLYNQLWILVDKIEYHVLGNHLLENGFALLFGAYYFKDKQLYKYAVSILKSELKEQILDDGAHFELSPMYHQLMLYRVLDCYNLVKNNHYFNQELLSPLKEKVQLMLGWLEQITFKNGDIPLLNDSAFGINPTTKQLINYAAQFNIKSLNRPLKESGYRKIANDNYEIVIDIGCIAPDYIPGHAHSDTFNFVLHVKGQPFIVDTGTSTYNPTERRQIERSTVSHNTVQIGDYEQSEIWSSFRVGRRSYPIIEKETSQEVIASLRYSTTSVTHYRHFEFKSNEIIIRDTINAKEKGKAFLHFHPQVTISIDENIIRTSVGLIFVKGADKIEIMEYDRASSFNILEKSQKAIIYFSSFLEINIRL
jgi:hypothetical protein